MKPMDMMGTETPCPVVLVVDDDRDIRVTLRQLLDEEGYEVVIATDGREALALLRGGLRPCAILLDLMMPLMDGWDFRAEQLRDPALNTIPVVLMTAAGFSAETIQSQLRGVDFVRKPLSLDEVLAAVARARAGSNA